MTGQRGSREEEILARLVETGSLSVSGLAAGLGVSEVTIRGDLRALERRGLLVRTRGGAVPSVNTSIMQREKANAGAKQRIAAAAAAMVVDHDTVMLEAGTTVALIVRHLASRRGLQVVTNSMLAFSHARGFPELNLILSGGVFHRESESLVGPGAERAMADFNTRLAFIGTDGFSPDRGLTTRFLEGAQVETVMSQHAEETWLVADSTKFGQAGFVSFLALDQLAGIITDSGLPDGALAALEEHTRVVVV
ncbi:MAG TPA: DeoR/GlpR family DNA-binding transcription regulator [Arachnia sp.]|nr:DeoR/GlpR family DNA-binding transcription regulator [Arachnia sp.]HMT85930.1 DeoR/GlpR family DNA-binding transcription regulator [Arachnia sp.]